MSRWLRGASLLALAALATLASGIATAQAKPFFESGLEETAITSTTDGTGATAHHTLVFAGLQTTCTTVDFKGTVKGKTSTELLLEPEFTNCQVIGIPTLVKMNGCAFLVHANTQFDIVSRAGKNCTTEPMTIDWTKLLCVVQIGPQAEITPQSGLGFFGYSNIKPGTTNEITMAIHLSELAYTATGAECGKTGKFSDGLYTTGNTILTGAKVGGEMTNLSWQRPTGEFVSPLSETKISSTADGSGAEAHHVFDVAGGSVTCSSINLTGTQTGKRTFELTLQASYKGCSFLGEPTTVETSGCTFQIRGNGTLVVSPCEKPITWEAKIGGNPCRIEIGTQSTPRSEIWFNNIKPGSFEEVTMEVDVLGIKYTATGKGCPKAGTFEDGKYTTGNTILTGAEPGGEGKMTNLRFE